MCRIVAYVCKLSTLSFQRVWVLRREQLWCLAPSLHCLYSTGLDRICPANGTPRYLIHTHKSTHTPTSEQRPIKHTHTHVSVRIRKRRLLMELEREEGQVKLDSRKTWVIFIAVCFFIIVVLVVNKNNSSQQEEVSPDQHEHHVPALSPGSQTCTEAVACGNQSRVKSMASRLLAKFEENCSPRSATAIRRQVCMCALCAWPSLVCTYITSLQFASVWIAVYRRVSSWCLAAIQRTCLWWVLQYTDNFLWNSQALQLN